MKNQSNRKSKNRTGAVQGAEDEIKVSSEDSSQSDSKTGQKISGSTAENETTKNPRSNPSAGQSAAVVKSSDIKLDLESFENCGNAVPKAVVASNKEAEKSKARSGMKPLALKINDVANMLSVSSATVRRLVDRGEFKVIRKLRHMLIPLSEVEAFVAVEGGRKGAQ